MQKRNKKRKRNWWPLYSKCLKDSAITKEEKDSVNDYIIYSKMKSTK